MADSGRKLKLKKIELIAMKFFATIPSYTLEKKSGAFANRPLSGFAFSFKECKKPVLKLAKYSCESNTIFCVIVSLISEKTDGLITFILMGSF